MRRLINITQTCNEITQQGFDCGRYFYFNEQALKSLDFQLPQLKGGVEINRMRANSSVSLKINIEKERKKKKPRSFWLDFDGRCGLRFAKERRQRRLQVAAIDHPDISVTQRDCGVSRGCPREAPSRLALNFFYQVSKKKKKREILYVHIKILNEECRPGGYPTRVLWLLCLLLRETTSSSSSFSSKFKQYKRSKKRKETLRVMFVWRTSETFYVGGKLIPNLSKDELTAIWADQQQVRLDLLSTNFSQKYIEYPTGFHAYIQK